jgi:threonine synthase
MALCAGSYEEVKRQFSAFSYSDEETAESMRELLGEFQYVCDPHGAVGYRALKEYLAQLPGRQHGMFLHTAHPAKFSESVAPIAGEQLIVPPALRVDQARQILAVEIENHYEEFKEKLLAQ